MELHTTWSFVTDFFHLAILGIFYPPSFTLTLPIQTISSFRFFGSCFAEGTTTFSADVFTVFPLLCPSMARSYLLVTVPRATIQNILQVRTAGLPVSALDTTT